MKDFEERVAHAEALFEQGAEAYNQGHFQSARDAWAGCVAERQSLVDEGHTELLPNLVGTRVNLAVCLDSLGELTLARTTYETTVDDYQNLIAQGRTELLPNLALTRVNLAVCLDSLGELALARTTYETTVDDYQNLIAQGRTELLPELARTRVNLANCLYSLGELTLARTTCETTVDDYQNLIAQGRTELLPELARTRVNLANCLYSLGELTLARTTCETTVDDYQNLIAQGRTELLPNLALTRMNLANCLYSLGELALARTTYETTVNDYQNLINQGRTELLPNLALTRMNLANCLYSLGELALARTTYETTVNDFQNLIAQGRTELLPDLAMTRMNLGICLWNLGELALARTTYETTVNDYQRLIAQGRTELLPDLAMTRMNLGICLANLGELALARTMVETTVNDYQRLIAQGRTELLPSLAHTRMNLAICLDSLGELALARTTYETTVNDYQNLIAQGRTDLLPNLALTRMNLANCLDSLGELALACTTYETTVDDYQNLIAQGRTELLPSLAHTRMNLAVCLYSLGELALARTTYETTVNDYQNLIAQGRIELLPELANTRVNLAICLYSLGELALARTTYETTVDDYQNLIAQGRTELLPNLAKTRMNLAVCLERIEDFPASETHYQEAFKLLQSLQKIGQLFPDAIKIIRNIADWHRHPQRPPHPDKPQAFKLAQLGLDWLDSVLSRLSDASTNFMLTENLPLFRLATDLALELDHPDQAYFILERSKSRVLVEQMLRERAEPGAQVDENLRTQYRELKAKLRALVQQLGTANGTTDDNSTRFLTPTTRDTNRPPEQTEQLWQEQQAIEQELDKVRRAITEQDAAFGEAIQPRPLTVTEVTALIPTDTLVIAFEQAPDFLRLYAITPQGISAPLQIPLSLQSIYERAVTFQNDMRARRMSRLRETVDTLNQWLNAQLTEPLAKLIAQFQPQHLIFIPHVAWHLLPIHLVTIDDEPLAVRYPVHYLPSMQILRLIRERQTAQQENGCIVANPTQDLAGAEQESQTVYRLRRQTDTLLSHQEANLSAVRKVLNNIQHSHFSCHGCFDPDLSKAGLLLADGLLPAKEMFTSIRMDNPRLVVMSACETAQIKPTLADEYMGLSSSFLFAGAHNVLATLWPVEDNATRLLIENFYQNLNAGLSPVNALQQAQAQLRELSVEDIVARSPQQLITCTYKAAYYWAGFVLIGDGE